MTPPKGTSGSSGQAPAQLPVAGRASIVPGPFREQWGMGAQPRSPVPSRPRPKGRLLGEGSPTYTRCAAGNLCLHHEKRDRTPWPAIRTRTRRASLPKDGPFRQSRARKSLATSKPWYPLRTKSKRVPAPRLVTGGRPTPLHPEGPDAQQWPHSSPISPGSVSFSTSERRRRKTPRFNYLNSFSPSPSPSCGSITFPSVFSDPKTHANAQMQPR